MLGSNNSKALIKSGYSVTATPTVIAEWNHNIINPPRICGSLTATPSASTFSTLTLTGISSVSSYRAAVDSRIISFPKDVSWTQSLTTSYSSNTISFPVTYGNAYRIVFFAKASTSATKTLLIRFRELSTSTVLDSVSSKAFTIDNIDYVKHEYTVKPKNSSANKIIMSFAVDVADSVYVSDMAVVEITNSEYQSAHLFNVRDTFSGFRPGDELMENSDVTTPLSDLIYQYRYGNDSTIIPSPDGKIYAPQYQRFSYYCQTYDNTLTNGVFAYYDKEIATNKIVIKMLNGNSTQQNTDYNNSIISYAVYVYSGTAWSQITLTSIDFTKNGYLKLYYTTSGGWTTTESNATIPPANTSILDVALIKGIAVLVTSFGYHNGTSATAYSGVNSFTTKSAKITNVTAAGGTVTYTAANTFSSGDVISISGVVTSTGTDAYNLQNVKVATASSTQFTVTNAATGTYSSGGMAVKPTRYDATVRYLEISPRLQVDLSNRVISFSKSAELESGDLPIATGLSTSNSSSVVFENIATAITDITGFSLFSDTTQRSPFSKYDLLKRDTKFRIKYSLLDNSTGTVTDSSLPFFVGYADEWSVSEENATATLFDIGKYLQNKKSEDIMIIKSIASNLQLSNIIDTILQQNGFSDYGTFPASMGDIKLSSYYVDPQKTVWESIQELMLPYSYFGYIDENGLLQISSYSDKSSDASVFKFTDTPITTEYLSNIIEFTPEKREKPSEILVRYSSISPKINTDTVKDDVDRLKFSKTRVKDFWEYGKDEYLGYSMLSKTLEADASTLSLDTTDWNTGLFGWGQYSGYLAIGSEIIKYNGMEIEYTTSAGLKKTQVVKSNEEFMNLQYQIFADQGINFNKTATFQYNGNLVNLERGMFGTKAKKHVVFDSKSSALTDLISQYSSPNPVLKVHTIPTKSSTFTVTEVSPVTDKYVNRFKDPKTRQNYFQIYSPTNGQTRLWWLNADNAKFDTYGFIFKMPLNNESAIAGKEKVGMFIKYAADGTGIFLEIVPSSNVSKTAKTSIYAISDNAGTKVKTILGTSNYTLDKKDMSKLSTYKKNKDGTYQRNSSGKLILESQPKNWDFSEQVSINLSAGNISVTINNKKLIWRIVQGNKTIVSTSIKAPTLTGSGIGVYAGEYSTINLQTIYATSSVENPFLITPEINKVDLSKVVAGGMMDTVTPFYISANPAAFGMTIIEDELQSGPGFGYQVLKTVGAYEIGSNMTSTLFKITENQSVVSGIDATPFKIRFAYLNVGPQIIPLKFGSDSFSTLKATFYGLTKSDEIVFSKKINSQSINSNSNTIEIQSDWIQTESNASLVAEKIAKGITNSLDTYRIRTFGNPLIIIGDIVNLYYNQGGFNSSGDTNPDKKYIVVGTENQFDGGFETTVKLRAINS